MRLGVKHANQTSIVRADFTGGLNTSTNIDGIAENQLTIAVNVEVDHVTGRLRTVAGTTDILPFDDIYAVVCDEINHTLLIAKNNKKVYAVDFDNLTISSSLGTLSGNLYPVPTSWEDGVLIASGGKLQYFNGAELVTIDSPDAGGVYIRAGRVLVNSANTVHYSGIGDETNWSEDTNDDSSSKFVEAGYKDGGHLVGMTNLSTDVLLIKDNRRLYRLSGEYPNWVISEVSRNVEVSNRLGFCSVADSVFILGRNEVQNIQTTNAYGDMKPTNIANLITKDIQSLSLDTKLRYVPPLNQIWAVSGSTVMVFDIVTQSWYKRVFNSPVIDVISIGDEVLVVKADRISKLDGNTFYDIGKPLTWQWQSQRLISQHDYLLKRTQVSIIPLSNNLYSGHVRVGGVVITLPVLEGSVKIYGNHSPIYKNPFKIYPQKRRRAYIKGEYVFENLTSIYENRQLVKSNPTIIRESRNVFRSKFIDVGGIGSMGGIIFNAVILDVAEV